MTQPTATQLPPYMLRDGFDPVVPTERVLRTDTTFGLPVWLITRHDDVREVLADATRFCNRLTLPFTDVSTMDAETLRLRRAGNLMAFDPPEHTRLRRMVTPEFTVRRMRALEPRVAEIVEQHLDAMERTGPPADLVTDFALPVPALVICELLGVPYTDRADFRDRTERIVDMSLPQQDRLAAMIESRRYLAGLVVREQADPGEALLGTLVRDHGDDLSTEELVGIAVLLLIAGHETTSNMIALGTLALLRHPEQLAVVRDDPDAVGPAVEELLRWLSIVHAGSTKTTTTEVEIGGTTIPAGELVMCALPTANRDPAAVADPDRLDVTRGAVGHLAFGHGVHHCVGAPLARMELRLALPALLRRFPGLAEVPGSAAFGAFNAVYGLSRLEVTW